MLLSTVPFFLFLLLVSLLRPVAHAQATEDEQQPRPSISVALYMHSSKDVTYTIYISPAATYAVGGGAANDKNIRTHQQQEQQLYTGEIFSATDAAGSVTVLPNSIVPSDLMSSLSLPTVLVTATDASPTHAPSWTLSTTTLAASDGSNTASLPMVTQNGTTKAVMPTTTSAHPSSQTASAGLKRSALAKPLLICVIAGISVWW